MHYDKTTDDVYRQHDITHTPTVHVYDASGALVSSDVYKLTDAPKLTSVLEGLVLEAAK